MALFGNAKVMSFAYLTKYLQLKCVNSGIFLVVSTAKTSNFSTEFEIKVFKEPNYRLTFIKTLTVNFAFSSNILQILLIFIHKKNIYGKKTVPLYSNIHYI